MGIVSRLISMIFTRRKPLSKPSSEGRDGWKLLLCGFVSAILLNLSFFPFNYGWVAWFALVPLLTLSRSAVRPGKLYSIAYLSGLALFVPALQWMRVADPRMVATWICLAVYCSCYYVVAIGLIRWLERSAAISLFLSFPIVWTGLEFARSHLLTGFAWYFLGHSQHDQLALIQIADVTGVYGISFLVAAFNAFLFELLWKILPVQSLYQRIKPEGVSVGGLIARAGILVVVFAGLFLYGQWRLGQNAQVEGPHLAMLQGSVPQGVRNEGSNPTGEMQREAVLSMWAHYAGLCSLSSSYKPDLIVWPETSVPGGWNQISPDYPPDRTPPQAWIEMLARMDQEGRMFASQWKTSLLLGVNTNVLKGDDKEIGYNSALLLDPLGQVKGRYDKIHRVPFGEYVPLKDSIPMMEWLSPYDFDYGVAAGTGNPNLPLLTRKGKQYSFGVTICYEDTDPPINWVYGRKDQGKAYDFIVNISNDGWFDGTAEHEQHLAISRFRSIETRRAMVRAVNMGISAVIDGHGRVLKPRQIPTPESLGILAIAPQMGVVAGFPWLPLMLRQIPVWQIPETTTAENLPSSDWAQYKKIPGVLLARVPIDSRNSLYPYLGDWLPWGCWGVMAFVFLIGRLRGPQFGQDSANPPKD